jgi:alpha-D-xyloside xylohydrolase
MRFGDGAWRMRDGVSPHYPSRVDALELAEDTLSLHVSSRLETSRGATLEGHMFGVRISSPLENVLRVQVTHHRGRQGRGPEFDLCTEPRPFSARPEVTAEHVQLRAGALALRIARAPWALEFSNAETGEPLTGSPFQALGLMQTEAGLFWREQLTLAVGEHIYGLGERFQSFTRNGQSVDLWNSDVGTCSDKAYKNVPFFLSSRGYGVLVNSTARVSFEIGTEQVMRAQFSVPGEDLDYFVILGPQPKQVLARLGELSGRPALPPAWSFGLWLTTSFTTQYDESTVNGLLDGMAERELPLHVFHFDCFWMQAHHWSNFRWDEAVFSDPEGMLSRLHARGLRVSVWINPTIGERSQLFAEGAREGYLLTRANGDVWQTSRWQAGLAWVDFTNPAARRWFCDRLRPLLRMGVDCFKTDFGDDVPTDVRYFDGSDPERMHNYYSFLYNQAVYELLEAERGPGQACVFARAATATCQRFPVHWGGDCSGSYSSMAETLRGGLSLGLCGFGFWSHDIGGFETQASAAVYKRWLGFGLLSSHSRLHGNRSFRVPWNYDEEACSVLRHFTQLKCRLMPYLFGAALQAHESNQPVLRAMLLEFPEDPACRTLDRQYMLGDQLLVAPVFHDRRAEFYLPEGVWIHLLSGEQRSGGAWFVDELDFFGIPLWIRPQALICTGTSDHQVEYDWTRGVRLICGKLDGKSTLSARLPDLRGAEAARIEVYHDGDRIRAKSSELADFQVQLPWARELVELERGSSVQGERRAPLTSGGVLVRADSGAVSFRYR